MDSILKEKWINALRSGQYKQGTGMLRSARNGTYCCLGVLCEILPEMRQDRGGYVYTEYVFGDGYVETSLPVEVARDLKLIDLQDTLMSMNDVERKSFDEIAAFLEETEF